MGTAKKLCTGAVLFLRGCTALAVALFILRLLLLWPVQRGDGFKTPRTRAVFVPAPIENVLADENRIYILYDYSSTVNVYDGEGTFLWAVSAVHR